MPKITSYAELTSPADDDVLPIDDISTTSTKKITMLTIGQYVLPAGVIVSYISNTIPNGWLLCDGSAVSRTTYSRLYAAVGTTYGAGNGTTTFNLPNLKGKVPVGRDSSDSSFTPLATAGGEKNHTLTTSEIPSHKHWISAGTYDDGNMSTTGTSNSQDTGLAADGGSYSVDDLNKPYGRYSLAAGGGGSHNNLQPYVVTNYLIKT